jgi:hypothetical protein
MANLWRDCYSIGVSRMNHKAALVKPLPRNARYAATKKESVMANTNQLSKNKPQPRKQNAANETPRQSQKTQGGFSQLSQQWDKH